MRYSVEHHGNVIMMSFVSATAELSPDAGRVDTRNSIVKSIVVEALSHGSVNMRIVLRGPAHHRIVEPDQSGLLYVDVYSDAPMLSPKPMTAIHERMKRKNPVMQGERRTPLVDIAAIVRNQVGTPEVRQTESKTVEPVLRTNSFEAKSGLQRLYGILFAITLVVGAAVSVVGVIYVRMKRRERNKGEPTQQEVVPEQSFVDAPAFDQEHVMAPVEEQEAHADPDAHMLLFAERFHRSQGEFHLTYTIEKEKSPRSAVKSLLHNGNNVETKSQRVKMAKKLGVGQGEVALAANLKGLQGKHIRRNQINEKESV
jgi:hypothetical protein